MDVLSSTLHFRPSFFSSSTLHSVTTSNSLGKFVQFHQPLKNSRKFHLSSSSRRYSKPLAVSSSAVSLHAGKDQLPADISVTETKEPGSRVRLSVEIPPIVCQDCYRQILDEISKNAKVPGFRPGKKIPENILVNYVGKQYVQQATIEAILKRTLPHAMSSVTVRALSDSARILTKFSELDETFSPQDFLRYDVVVDVAPEIKWATDNGYKNMKIVVEIDEEISAEKAAETEFRRRYNALGSLRIVTNRGLLIGDVAVLDIFAATINQDESIGEKIPSAESKGFNLDTEDSNHLLPGFLDSLIGIQRGETKSFPFVFPETWKQENLQGVHAQFTVECKELFYRDLPKMDDSLATKLLPGCSTLDQVKESLLQKCKEMEKTAIEQATDNAILDKLSKMVEVDIPQSLFEEQGRQLYGAQLLQIQANSKLDAKQLEYLSSERTVNEYLEKQKESISSIIRQMLAVGEIFKRENLQFSTEELVREVENSISEFKRHNQEYDEDRVKDQVQEILEGAKVLEWLREHSEIQYIFSHERTF